MREQLKALLAAIDARSAVLQVIPLDAGAHPALDGALALLSFPDGPDIGYVSGHGAATLIEALDRVTNCRYRYDLSVAAALPLNRSADVIHTVMEDL